MHHFADTSRPGFTLAVIGMQPYLVEAQQTSLLCVHLSQECLAAIAQARLLAKLQEGGQHAADLVTANPGRIFDPRSIVGYRQGIASEALQSIALGYPGRQQRCRRGDADLLQRATHLRLGETRADALDIQLDGLQRAEQQHFMEFGGPQRGVGEYIEEATHQGTAVLLVLRW
ncbi:hypothetical protein D9M68_786370 [compost metagenome]